MDNNIFLAPNFTLLLIDLQLLTSMPAIPAVIAF